MSALLSMYWKYVWRSCNNWDDNSTNHWKYDSTIKYCYQQWNNYRANNTNYHAAIFNGCENQALTVHNLSSSLPSVFSLLNMHISWYFAVATTTETTSTQTTDSTTLPPTTSTISATTDTTTQQTTETTTQQSSTGVQTSIMKTILLDFWSALKCLGS